jgi:hypothetical protein
MAVKEQAVRRGGSIAVAALVALGALGVVAVWAPGLGGASGNGCTVVVTSENGAHNALQLVINAHPGGVICVGPGTYPEQVTISAAHTVLRGSGATKTVLAPTSPLVLNTVDWDSASAPHDISGLVPAAAIVLVANTTGVTVSGIGVNGAPGASTFAPYGCSDEFYGVDFQNSSGTLTASRVLGVALPPNLFGCQDGQAVYAYNGYFLNGGPPSPTRTVTVSSTLVSGFDKTGILCDDLGETCVLTADVVTGGGPITTIAQNGVQIGYGALGQLRADQVSLSGTFTAATGCPTGDQDNYAVCSGNEGAGVLLYDSASGSYVTASALVRNEVGIYYYDDGTYDGGSASTTISHNRVVSSTAYGIVAQGAPGGADVVAITANSINNRPIADPAVWGAPGILVDTGTFHITANALVGSLAQAGASNGLAQAVCGPTSAASWSPILSCATNESLSTAAIQGASESATNPTTLVVFGNVYAVDTYHVNTEGVLGGTVDVTT